MSLLSIRFGTNDKNRAKAFYDATFGAIGIGPSKVPDEYPIAMYQLPGGQALLIGPALDGNPATHANGGTVLFKAESEAQVQAWHQAGLDNGGRCEGAPEGKPQAGNAFGAYLRDPDGNKIGCYFGLSFGA